MPGRFAKWLGVILGLGIALVTPAAAQEPIPSPYPEISHDYLRLAVKDKPADQIAAEQAAADSAEARCNSGNLAGCAALGQAFISGEGRPQNRPVAELLLRQACDGAEAAACLGLGQLLRSTSMPPIIAEGTLILGRACRLGNLEACVEEADAVERGNGNAEGNREAASALRRAACAQGSNRACRALGRALLRSDNLASVAEGQALLENTCRKGDGQACSLAADALKRDDPPRLAEAREMVGLGCDAGVPYQCRELGDMLFLEESGPPEARTAALAAFDRACALESMFCGTSADIRSLSRLEESCRQGAQADCLMLGRLYARDDLPTYSPRMAEQILSRACFDGLAEACGPAARVLDEAAMSDAATDSVQIAKLYTAGCEGGVSGDCDTLGMSLLSGDPAPEDRARGYALLALACERDYVDSCEKLDFFAMSDSSVPMVPVDARYGPPLSPEEEAELDRREREAKEAAAADRCRSSEVAFRGTVYRDTICYPPAVAITRGRLALAGEAPWQALFWRPERMNRRTLTTAQRVECGGALIREGWVLTAAHCVVDKNGRPVLTAGYQVRLGVLDASLLDGVNYGVRRVYVHDRYDRPSRTFDIALVELETRRRLRVGTPHPIKPIRFEGTTASQRAPRAGAPVYVYGWGDTAFQGQSSKLLKAAKLALEDRAKCDRDNGLIGSFSGTILCAKAADRSQACDGDSGGPLVSYEGVATVIGVVSAGTECGRRGDATRYTRVSAVRDWINKVLAGQVAPFVPR